jgi:hypothetical protein
MVDVLNEEDQLVLMVCYTASWAEPNSSYKYMPSSNGRVY